MPNITTSKWKKNLKAALKVLFRALELIIDMM